MRFFTTKKYHWTRKKATMTTKKVNLFSPLLKVHPGYQSLYNICFLWGVVARVVMCRARQHLCVPSCSRQGENKKYNLADLLPVWSIFYVFPWKFLEGLQVHMECTRKTWKLQNFQNCLLALCNCYNEKGIFGQNEESATKIFLYCMYMYKTLHKFLLTQWQYEEQERHSMLWQRIKGVSLEVLWSSPQTTTSSPFSLCHKRKYWLSTRLV